MATQVSGASASLAKEMYANLSQEFCAKISTITNAYLKADALRNHVMDRYVTLTTKKVKPPALSELDSERAYYYASYRTLRKVYKESEAFEKTLNHGYEFLKADRVTKIVGPQMTEKQLEDLQNYVRSFRNARTNLANELDSLKGEDLYDFHTLVQNRGRPLNLCQTIRYAFGPLPKVKEILKGSDEVTLRDPIKSMEVETTLLSVVEDEKEHKTLSHPKEGTLGVDVQDNSTQTNAQKDEFVYLPYVYLPANLRFRKIVRE